MYVYEKTEPRLWTTGFYKPNGEWVSDEDYNSKAEAAARVAFLNGESTEPLGLTPTPVWKPTMHEPFIAKVIGDYTIAVLKSGEPTNGQWYVKTVIGVKTGVSADDVYPITKAVELLGMPVKDFVWRITMSYLGVDPTLTELCYDCEGTCEKHFDSGTEGCSTCRNTGELPAGTQEAVEQEHYSFVSDVLYPNVQPGKIKVETPEQSEAVQKVLFELGYRWYAGEQNLIHTDSNFLYWNIGYLNFSNQDPNFFKINPEQIHTLADFGIESDAKPLTVEDFPLGQRVNHESYGKGIVVTCPLLELTKNDVLPVKFDDEKKVTRYFNADDPLSMYRFTALTKLPTPKPFGPEDAENKTTGYCQNNRAWTCTEFDSRPGIKWPACFQLKDENGLIVGSVWVDASGDSSTGIKFTRTKPEA